MSGHEEIEPRAEFAVMERSRATPVRPAIWMTGILVWATVIALFLHVPTWAGIFLCSLTGLSFLLFLVSYSYLMLYDRGALRRERLQVKGRQVLERDSLVSASIGLIGDQPQPAVVETHPLATGQAEVIRRGDA
jgi:hypothetical protein